MKKIASFLAAASVIGLSFSASAGEDPMTPYYSGALIASIPGKFESRTWYDKNGILKIFFYELTEPKGSFTLAGRDGKYRLAGKDGAYKLCQTIGGRPDAVGAAEYGKDPAEVSQQGVMAAMGKEVCSDFSPHKVGDSWDETIASGPNKGAKEHFSLVAGRE